MWTIHMERSVSTDTSAERLSDVGKHDGKSGQHTAGKGGAHSGKGTAKDTGYVGTHRNPQDNPTNGNHK